MPHDSLADFLEGLEQAGWLRRVAAEVSPAGEMAALAWRVASGGGPALLVQRPEGHRYPVALNLLATPQRIALALGVDSLERPAERIGQVLAPQPPNGWLDRLRGLAGLGAAAAGFRTVKAGACQQVVKPGRDVDLSEWPWLEAWPEEARRSLSGALLVGRDSQTGRPVWGTAAILPGETNRLTMAWPGEGPLARLLDESVADRRSVALAVVVGGPPLVTLLANAPPRAEIDPAVWAELLAGRSIETVRCRTQELEVPAAADVVFETRVEPGEPAGPGGVLADAGGFYRSVARGVTLVVEAVTHRANPVFWSPLAGPPPNEIRAMAAAWQRWLRPLVQLAVPEVVDYATPEAVLPGDVLVVAIRKRRPYAARQVAAALWGLGYTADCRQMVLVDEDVDPAVGGDVLAAIAAHAEPGRDLFAWGAGAVGLAAAAGDAAPRALLAVDATRKRPDEGGRPSPAQARASAQIDQLLARRWKEYGG